VPVFEAAEDVAEVTAGFTGSYSDTSVEADQEYFYWLVQADNEVEVAMTEAFTTKLATTPQAPEEPETPQEPVTPETPEEPETPETPEEPETPEQPEQPQQPGQLAMFIPLVQR
jgi:hypothetical protein